MMIRQRYKNWFVNGYLSIYWILTILIIGAAITLFPMPVLLVLMASSIISLGVGVDAAWVISTAAFALFTALALSFHRTLYKQRIELRVQELKSREDIDKSFSECDASKKDFGTEPKVALAALHSASLALASAENHIGIAKSKGFSLYANSFEQWAAAKNELKANILNTLERSQGWLAKCYEEYELSLHGHMYSVGTDGTAIDDVHTWLSNERKRYEATLCVLSAEIIKNIQSFKGLFSDAELSQLQGAVRDVQQLNNDAQKLFKEIADIDLIAMETIQSQTEQGEQIWGESQEQLHAYIKKGLSELQGINITEWANNKRAKQVEKLKVNFIADIVKRCHERNYSCLIMNAFRSKLDDSFYLLAKYLNTRANINKQIIENNSLPSNWEQLASKAIAPYHPDRNYHNGFVADIVTKDFTSAYKGLDSTTFLMQKIALQETINDFAIIECSSLGYKFPDFKNADDIADYIEFLHYNFDEKFVEWFAIINADIAKIDDPALMCTYEIIYKHDKHLSNDNARHNSEMPHDVKYYLSKAIDEYGFLSGGEKEELKSKLEKIINQFNGSSRKLAQLAKQYSEHWQLHSKVARGSLPDAMLSSAAVPNALNYKI